MTAPDDDRLTFIEDESIDSGKSPLFWRLLVVDDDEDVHRSTEFALRDLVICERPLRLLHAYTAAEAEQILANEPDVAVVILDVVMESEQAGLQLVERIRRGLQLTNLRIILATGQPGYAPEMEAIRDYDINDYKTKNELTRNKLYTSITAAIRSYQQICKLDASRNGLELIVSASNQLTGETGMQSFAAGVITQLAALIGVPPEGLVCVQQTERSNGDSVPRRIVIAAAGQYAPFIRGRLEDIADSTVREAFGLCFEQKVSIFANDHIVLFFPAGADQHFAAYIATHHPPIDIDRHLLEVFCTNISVSAENIRLLSRLHDYAYVDRLLAIPNRTAFVEAMEEGKGALGGNEALVVALIDINEFAEINETFGCAYGDAVLRAAALRLARLPGDRMVARVAGDAFGVLGPASAVVPNELLALFDDPLEMDGLEHRISVCIGLVRLEGEHIDGHMALENASIALKRAKSHGAGSHAYYTEHVGAAIRERTRLLYDLRQAVAKNLLFLAYQPQVELMTGRVVGLEALMRWRDQRGNHVPPDRFIPVAESAGIIRGLGKWVLRSALLQLKRLHESGWPELRMAVNVSVVQFEMLDFLAMVQESLVEARISPRYLELEVTESVAMTGADHVRDVLRQLKALGVTMAIDDFGTGFSSLSYLDNLPVDRLKIDKSFVSTINGHEEGARIAEMVVDLGRKLGLTVIAEGVETETQAQLLKRVGCHEGQGYLYARPLPADDLLGWLTSFGVPT
ncbi:putative bifunctional diguanylate cyclase/phosphodiesterase [Denitratisoma oestradiolicum]|uniref:Response regulator receiver protein n=1 Tax=Denitratisoma oestradiolicum TaxID=311182 RepID=A0A6S6XZ09_9PROT|nr:EAL domain-containing protein [Denitratisoma oestradiolicum]TWO79040.1 hypothetical protein CBW56_16815 [Denitratisoma oestradiolicum]CAB1369411.1 Response regulator receiver protein [Denitratisoma oestradiolicum]